MWPFRKPDVFVEMFVSLGQHLRLHRDAIGRPYVKLWGSEVELLLPGGKTASGRLWTPLSNEAAAVWGSGFTSVATGQLREAS